MKQGKGTDVLGANDPRSSAIGVIYVSPNDDRKSVLAAILTQEKLGRKQVAVVLPEEQNKAFQRPGDFDDLKAMRRKLQTQVIFIAPSGPGPAELARQRRFLVYSSLENYANALRDETQLESASKKGWLFGSPRTKADNAPDGSSGEEAPSHTETSSPSTQELNTPSNGRYDDEEERHDTGPIAPLVAGAALGGGVALAVHSAVDGHNGNGVLSGGSRASADPYRTDHSFSDDEDDLGLLPATAGRRPASANGSGATQAIPASRPGAADGASDGGGSIIELRPRRSSKATLPLTPREPGVVPVTPVMPETESTTQLPRPKRSTGKMVAAGAAGALLGAGAVSAVEAAPTRGSVTPGRASGAAGAGAVAPRPGTPGGVPPRSAPPGRGGGGGRGNGRGPQRRRGWLLPLALILLILLLAGGGIAAYALAQPKSAPGQIAHSLLAGQQSPATITITPDSKTVQDTYTLVGGATTNATTRQVAVRTITGAAQSASIPVKATGHAQHAAVAASGHLTFFNGLGTPRQINAGFSLPAGGGVSIVLNQTAYMPASTGVVTGPATVTAHAVPAGRAGNIGAYTFNIAQCCAANITVTNTAAFTGGQDAVNYSFLVQSDVNNAISQSVMNTTKQDALNDVNRQLRPGEQLLGGTHCATTLQVDEPIGDQGTNVNNANVTYVMKCTSTSYDNLGAQNIVKDLITQKASTDPGTGYVLINNIQTNLMSQSVTNKTTSFFFSGKGIWAYQFSDTQKLALARKIAGKSVTEAQNILKTTPGVGSATISVNGGNTLPTDYNQISIVIQPIGGLGGGTGSTPTAGSPTVTGPTVQGGNPGGTGKGGSAPPN